MEISEALDAAPVDDQPDPGRIERAATWLSLACAVHCVALPLLTSLAPLFDLGRLSSPVLDDAMMMSVLLLAAFSGALGFRRHRDLRIVGALLLSLGLYLGGHLSEGVPYAATVSVLGALALSASLFTSARRAHAHSEACAH